MEVKKGYKQTEVGVIPEDWEAIPIGNIFEFKNGLNKAKEYFGKGTPIVNYMDVFNNLGLLNKDVEGKVTLTADEIRNYQVKKGDVFFTRTSETVDEIGMSSVLLENITAAVFSGFVLRGRPKNDILALLYKQYCFRSKEVRKQICSTSSYTTRALTNGKLLSNVYIPVPPTKAEQTAIAAALGDVDALIQSLEKLIAKKRNIKQGAMQKCLNCDSYDLYDEDDLKIQKKNQGNQKNHKNHSSDKWVVKKLGEIAEVVGGGTPSTFNPTYWNGDINWFTPTEIGDNKYSYESSRRITKEGLASCSAKLLPVGTILLTSRASIGDISILRKEACTNQGFQSLIPKQGYNNELIYYLMLTLKSLLLQFSSGSTFLEISPNKLKTIEIHVPNYEEQTRIATILSDMDAEIAALETKLTKYKQIKQGMMQELLMGRTRLI